MYNPVMDNKVRLNKFIASSGICSRRKADELIAEGKVKINGKIITELGTSVSTKDEVIVEGKKLNTPKLTYIRYYKPAGYITTMDDEKGRKTIYDLLPEEVQTLKPVGRLDKDSTGLLIMTNDGDLINQLTHPSVKVPKVYRVVAEGKVTIENLQTMADGIEIEKGQIAYADSQIIDYESKNTVLEIVLYQGLNRQIRKMLDFVGHPVVSLKRLSCANIDLSGLKRGQFKYLKPKQVSDLRNYIKKLEKQSKLQ